MLETFNYSIIHYRRSTLICRPEENESTKFLENRMHEFKFHYTAALVTLWNTWLMDRAAVQSISEFMFEVTGYNIRFNLDNDIIVTVPTAADELIFRLKYN